MNKYGIETLLNLDGIVIEQAGGHWAKFEVREVSKTEEIPHGIRYSLTLHDRNGKRIMVLIMLMRLKELIKENIKVEKHSTIVTGTRKTKVLFIYL